MKYGVAVLWVCTLAMPSGAPAVEPDRHWSYVPPVRPALPQIRQADRATQPVDTFILARLEREGIPASSSVADKSRLIRRVALDLTGLPPTPDEVSAFLQDDAPDAYERVVDMYLASPRFGERMAREWLEMYPSGDSRPTTAYASQKRLEAENVSEW